MCPLVQLQRAQAVICRVGWRCTEVKEQQSCPRPPHRESTLERSELHSGKTCSGVGVHSTSTKGKQLATGERP